MSLRTLTKMALNRALIERTLIHLHRNERCSCLNRNLRRVLGFGQRANLFALGLRRKKSIAPIVAFALTVYAKSSDSVQELQRLLSKADELFEANQLDQMMDLLKSVDRWQDNNEVLWRIARHNYHQLKYRTDKGSKEFMDILADSFSIVEKSLQIDDKCGPAHKWTAIILNEYATAQGTKVRIANLLRIREHMEKAIEYTPDDPTSYYLLGEWHFGCCSVSWVERNLAKIIYGTLPEASYETALEMYERAETLKPGFYSKNHLMIAKTLIALNRDKGKAIEYLKSIAIRFRESKKWADVEAYKEAISLLNRLGEKVPEVN